MNTINPEDARYFIENAKKGDEEILTSLAIAYCEGHGIKQDYTKALECYRKAAELGYEVAQCDLAYMYRMGYGTPKDIREAVYWYTKSAEQGFSDAQLELGVMYHNGDGVEQDYEESLYWYKKAAEQGNARAQENLAYMALSGEGMEMDMQMAIRLFNEAAKQGMPESLYNMGIFFVRGEYIQRDLKLARFYFEQAARQGLQQAYDTLKALDDLGANEDTSVEDAAHDEAVRVFLAELEAKANSGDMNAQYRLACAYNDGDPLTGEDYGKAFKYFLMAAEQGHMEAQCNLGVQYLYGYGIEQDFEQGTYWLEKATAQGDDVALSHLERLYAGDYDYYNQDFSPAEDRIQSTTSEHIQMNANSEYK